MLRSHVFVGREVPRRRLAASAVDRTYLVCAVWYRRVEQDLLLRLRYVRPSMVLLLREPEAVKTFAPTLEAHLRRGHHPPEKDAGVVHTTYSRSLIYFIVERRRGLQERHIIGLNNDDARYLTRRGVPQSYGGSMRMTDNNRRAVVVIEERPSPGSAKPPLKVALVIIGGVTVDSIRLQSTVKEGASIERGALLGSFARGGSSIAMFFNRRTVLVDECAALQAKGMDFKIEAGASLSSFVDS